MGPGPWALGPEIQKQQQQRRRRQQHQHQQQHQQQQQQQQQQQKQQPCMRWELDGGYVPVRRVSSRVVSLLDPKP